MPIPCSLSLRNHKAVSSDRRDTQEIEQPPPAHHPRDPGKPCRVRAHLRRGRSARNERVGVPPQQRIGVLPVTAETKRTETLRDRAERELVEDLQFRVTHERGDYQLQRILAGGTVAHVRPVTREMWTLWSEAVRGRVALLERWMKETGEK